MSYSRADEEYVKRLVRHLRSRGLSIWYDHQIATGDRFDKVIARKIEACAAFVVVMTPAAYDSNWVASEIIHAKNHNRPILPLLLDGNEFISLNYLGFGDVRGGCLPHGAFVSRLCSLVGVELPRPKAITGNRSDGAGVPYITSAWLFGMDGYQICYPHPDEAEHLAADGKTIYALVDRSLLRDM